MQATGKVHWCASLAESPHSGTAAWIASLAECRAFVGPTLAPNPTDLADIGARRGIDAEHFLQRRLTLRSLVARHCGVPASGVVVGYREAGRPMVRSPRGGPFCSVAARGEIAGFAVSHAPVGIDVEPVLPGPIADAVLSPHEQAELDALPEAARMAAFLAIWTVKEAYLKAVGTGLLRDPSTLTIARSNGIIRDTGNAIRLPRSAVRSLRSGWHPVAAACISLPAISRG